MHKITEVQPGTFEVRNGITHLIGWVVKSEAGLFYPVPYRGLEQLEPMERDLEAAAGPEQAQFLALRDMLDEGRHPDPCGYPTVEAAALAFLCWLASDDHRMDTTPPANLSPAGWFEK